MAEKQPFEQDLAEIRNLMEKSSKFLSLSGLSGILAGVYALLGVAAVVFWAELPLSRIEYSPPWPDNLSVVVKIVIIALAVLVASVATGLTMSAGKAKRQGTEFWNETTRRLIVNLAVPLLTGGAFIILLLLQDKYALVAPACLIFYGLALINASSKLFDEVRYLAYSEIILGLVCTAMPGYSLLLWGIGFGVFHVFYGAIMYRKYDG